MTRNHTQGRPNALISPGGVRMPGGNTDCPLLDRPGANLVNPRHLKVVIVGVGFAGLAAAKALRRAPVQITVVDQHDYHTFTPFLYQVTTALLESGGAAYPARGQHGRPDNVSFRLATVTGVDLDTKTVHTDQGPLTYDHLVLTAGAVNNYVGHPGIAEHTIGFNNLPEALQLRTAILAPLEAAAWADDPAERARLLSFAVVGGGPTGTEFAGALAERVAGTLTRDFPGLDPSQVSITLAEGSPHLRGGFLAVVVRVSVQALGDSGDGAASGWLRQGLPDRSL